MSKITKIAAAIAGVILGGLFIMASVVVLFGLIKDGPVPAEGTPAAAFMAAFGPTGYMTFVKILELVGGLLVIVPKTRNFGLLILGPILVNILAYHVFIAKGTGLLEPMLILIVICAAFLLWVERKAFLSLLK